MNDTNLFLRDSHNDLYFDLNDGYRALLNDVAPSLLDFAGDLIAALLSL